MKHAPPGNEDEIRALGRFAIDLPPIYPEWWDFIQGDLKNASDYWNEWQTPRFQEWEKSVARVLRARGLLRKYAKVRMSRSKMGDANYLNIRDAASNIRVIYVFKRYT